MPKKSENIKKVKKILFVPYLLEELELYFNLTLDRIFFFFFKEIDFAKSFLRDALPQELLDKLDLEKLSIEPIEQIDENLKRYYLDMLYQVPLKDGSGVQKFYTILEHKSYPDYWTMFQGFQYAVEILSKIRQKKQKILPTTVLIIVHQGKKPFSEVTNMRDYFSPDPVLQKYAIHFPAIVYDTSPQSQREFIFDPNAPIKDLVLKMMRNVSEKDVRSAAKQLLEEIRRRPPDSKLVRLRRLFLVSLEKIAKMKLDEVVELEKSTALKGVDEMSVFEQMILEKAKESKAEGLEEGLEAGRVAGLEEGARTALLCLLKRKFKRIPRQMAARIEQIRDTTVLQSLIVSAGMCFSIQEFEEDMV